MALLENHLQHSRNKSKYIQIRRAENTGRAREILLEQKTELETRAISYELMAREVALTELQQQRVDLSADHSAQLDGISLHVRNRKLKPTYIIPTSG